MSDFIVAESYRNNTTFTDSQPYPRRFAAEHVSNDTPPPIPRRSNSSVNYPSSSFYGGYNSMFSNPYQSFYPGYSYNNGAIYQQQSMSNGVEDATRSAFQSAESMIRAFSSVSMMLESTLFALQNSVRAIASVADQFSNLKIQLMSSLLSIIRTIRYYFRRMLILFKVRRPESHDQIWKELQGSSISNDGRPRHWPILLFFAVTIGMPWMLWKFLSNVIEEKQQDDKWHEGIGEHYIAEASYNFKSENSDELSITANEIIRVAPKHKQPNVQGWLLASNGSKIGLVPANYVNIKGKNRAAQENQNDSSEIEETSSTSNKISEINDTDNNKENELDVIDLNDSGTST